MDIQAMVDARIESLRKQRNNGAAVDTTLAGIISDRHDYGTGGRVDDENRYDAGGKQYDIRGNRCDVGEELKDLGELSERVLMDIAARVLTIAEQASGDYARLEDILNSRLAILQGAEVVLDMAVSLKQQARRIIEGSSAERRRPGQALRTVTASRNWNAMHCHSSHPSRLEGRASMKAHGVADLFRKTND